jgi:tripartite-type tricarboxylate transporter receptor subunit TctC
MRAMLLRLGLCLCALTLSAAKAAEYPTRPVHIVVGLTAGSGVDIMARMVAQKLADSMGQPFIVENRPGAGSNIATRYAAS